MLTVFFSYNLQPIPYRLDGFLPITLIDLSIACVSISLVCGLNPANLFSISIRRSSFSGGSNPSAFCRYSYRLYKIDTNCYFVVK